jgi:hypothetical protein
VDELPRRGRGTGRIAGEPVPFVASSLDAIDGRVHITVVQRGSRIVERLQAVMSRDEVEIQLPGDDRVLVAAPIGIDVTAAAAGGATLYRIDLTLQREREGALAEEAADTGQSFAPEPDLAERLKRIEAKLDRLLALLDRDTTTPGA